MPAGNKPLPEPMLTQIFVAIWLEMPVMGHVSPWWPLLGLSGYPAFNWLAPGGFDYCLILAPNLTSRACALRVCSPPAAIAVTQAISQTLICKALRIDSPSHAQMNKQRHKTWSFCLKCYILSKSNKIQRQVGGIFHLWQFLLDQIAHGRWPGIKKWRNLNKWKPWSFQLHCTVKPYFSVTKWKMHLLNTW